MLFNMHKGEIEEEVKGEYNKRGGFLVCLLEQKTNRRVEMEMRRFNEEQRALFRSLIESDLHTSCKWLRLPSYVGERRWKT